MNGPRPDIEASLADYLRALPDAEPPPALRGRVVAAMGARDEGGSREPAWLGLALAASLALAVGVAVMWPAAGPDPGPQARAQALEHRLLADPAAAGRAGPEVAVIDRALAAAYRRGAAQDELDGLWQARVRVLEQALDASPVQPARI